MTTFIRNSTHMAASSVMLVHFSIQQGYCATLAASLLGCVWLIFTSSIAERADTYSVI